MGVETGVGRSIAAVATRPAVAPSRSLSSFGSKYTPSFRFSPEGRVNSLKNTVVVSRFKAPEVRSVPNISKRAFTESRMGLLNGRSGGERLRFSGKELGSLTRYTAGRENFANHTDRAAKPEALSRMDLSIYRSLRPRNNRSVLGPGETLAPDLNKITNLTVVFRRSPDIRISSAEQTRPALEKVNLISPVRADLTKTETVRLKEVKPELLRTVGTPSSDREQALQTLRAIQLVEVKVSEKSKQRGLERRILGFADTTKQLQSELKSALGLQVLPKTETTAKPEASSATLPKLAEQAFPNNLLQNRLKLKKLTHQVAEQKTKESNKEEEEERKRGKLRYFIAALVVMRRRMITIAGIAPTIARLEEEGDRKVEGDQKLEEGEKLVDMRELSARLQPTPDLLSPAVATGLDGTFSGLANDLAKEGIKPLSVVLNEVNSRVNLSNRPIDTSNQPNPGAGHEEIAKAYNHQIRRISPKLELAPDGKLILT